MKKILIAGAMVLAMSATADARRIETSIGYIDTDTNIHYQLGTPIPIVLTDDQDQWPRTPDGGTYNPYTRTLVGEQVGESHDSTMPTLSDSDWQVVGSGDSAADQWRIASQNMSDGMSGNVWITINPNADLTRVNVFGRTINVKKFRDRLTGGTPLVPINAENRTIVRQEATRVAVEQAYHEVFGTVVEATTDGTAERAMLDQQSYKFGQNAQYVDTDSILSQAQAAHADGYTGQGLDITVNPANLGEVGRIAPDATRRVHMMDSATVAKSNDTIMFDAGNSRVNAQNAAGTALIWDKFDNVNGSVIEDHVDDHMTNGLINISGALAPVGLLN